MLRITLLSTAVCLSACATSHVGWTGSGAQPFDASLNECVSKTQSIPDRDANKAALNQCMAAKGWTPK